MLKVESSRTQPAYKMFVFGRGWSAWRYVCWNILARAHFAGKQWRENAASLHYLFSEKFRLLLYPAWLIIIGFYGASLIQYIPSILVVILFALLYPIILCLWMLLAACGILIVASVNMLHDRLLRVSYFCPVCYRSMQLPIYLCPTCEAEHTHLVANSYGILTHRCRCGTKLATHGKQRKQLPHVCAHCRSPLHAGIGDGPSLHIALIGGPAVGKTTYMLAALEALKDRYKRQQRAPITLTNPLQNLDYTKYLQDLQAGTDIPATTAITPQAWILKMKAPRALLSQLIYLYDPSGETFASNTTTAQQGYYSYCHGFIIIIDPQSLSTPASIQQGGVSTMHRQISPTHVYERMMQALESFVGVHARKQYQQPVAVVVTKSDQLSTEAYYGTQTVKMPAQHKMPSETINKLTRELLCQRGLDNVVRDLESHFAHVRYFSCSALNELQPGQKASNNFTQSTREPLAWILEQKSAIKTGQ